MDGPLQAPTPVQGEAGPPTADRTDNLAGRPPAPRSPAALRPRAPRGGEAQRTFLARACTRRPRARAASAGGGGGRQVAQERDHPFPGLFPAQPASRRSRLRIRLQSTSQLRPSQPGGKAEAGAGRRRGWKEQGCGPLLPPAWLGRVCPPRPGQPSPLGEARARPRPPPLLGDPREGDEARGGPAERAARPRLPGGASAYVTGKKSGCGHGPGPTGAAPSADAASALHRGPTPSYSEADCQAVGGSGLVCRNY